MTDEDDKHELVMQGLRGISNDDNCYAADRDAADRAIDYIKSLLREIGEKDKTILALRDDLVRVYQPLPHHRPVVFPESRGTTHGQLMQMQHEAETMHDNPPHDQPMG